MHILDDPTGLSTRARNLLERTGWRERPHDLQVSTEHLQARDCRGRLIPPPMLLVIRREGFEYKYAGLRYRVRRSLTFNGERHERVHDWHYDLGRCLWADPNGGGYFDWIGERVSSPVRYLIHTDGRVGVEDGNAVFLEAAPSINALIESHALTDMVSDWDRSPSGADALHIARSLDGLEDIPEASGPTVRWRLSQHVAVCESQNWSSTEPRQWRAFIWCRGEAGHRQLEEATALKRTGLPEPGTARR
ncbi:MAG: hypothetical protein ACJ786_19285 [Catenulispora sp.]